MDAKKRQETCDVKGCEKPAVVLVEHAYQFCRQHGGGPRKN